jgi:DNA-binding LacI/PurR family transcriptional regulator
MRAWSAGVYEVGSDDGELAEALDLTTVRQPLEESGRAAANLVIDRLGSPNRSTRDVYLRVSLVARGST